MKQLSIDEVKKVSLEILLHIHQICVDNNIRYSMWGGSLIGAVRHHGFIPWDDDIDLCMPRPDFERFFQIFKDNDEYAAFSYGRNGALLPWGRVCEMKKTCSLNKYKYTDRDCGVYVSIFPIDGTEDDLDQLVKRYDKCGILSAEHYLLRSLFAPLSSRASIKTNLILVARRIKHILHLKELQKKMQLDIKMHIEECKMFDFNTSSYVTDMGFSGKKYRPKHLWPKEDFEEVIPTIFEGHQVLIIKGYDRNLRLRFGDYMQLPPMEQRVAAHSHVRFFWRY